MKQKAHPRYRMLRLMLPLFLFIFGCFTPYATAARGSYT